MKHHLRISVSKESPPDGAIFSCKRVSMRERIMRSLFGERKRLTILVPGDSVDEVAITQTGGDNDENTASV